jgi:hypothetical protein
MTVPQAMTDAEKKACVEELVSTDGLRLADGARSQYQKTGRGCWVAAFRRGTSLTECWWASESALSEAESGIVKDEVVARVAAYKPGRQYVLLVQHFDGSTASATINAVPIGQG